MGQNKVDLLVVGAGPVGLFCANEAIRHGLSCQIIDKKEELSTRSKALGLHIRSLDVMQDCGFLANIFEEGLQINELIPHSNGKKLAQLSLAKADGNWPYLIDIPQNQTEKVLADGLINKGVEIQWNTELIQVSQDEQGVTSVLKTLEGTKTIESAWLIACDGGHSTVRTLLNMRFSGLDYKENWWLADLYVDWEGGPKDHSMNFYLHKDGPLACFPMKNNRYRLVMLAPEGHDERTPTLEQVIETFNMRSSDKAELRDPIWISKFNLHHRQIEHYSNHRIFFAGDAAHVHSPMGGQGLNTGIQDGYNLIWKLSLFHKNLVKKSVLDSYHTERYAVGKSVLQKTHIMTKMILLKNPLLVKLRNFWLSMMLSIPAIQSKIAANLSELTISYENSPIVSKFGSSKFRVGMFYKDFFLKAMDSEELEPLHSIIQGTAHHLFLFEGLEVTRLEEIEAIVKIIQENYPEVIIPHIIVTKAPIRPFQTRLLLDEKQKVHQQFSIKNSTAVLFRPDKYVGLIQAPVDKEELASYLSNIFV